MHAPTPHAPSDAAKAPRRAARPAVDPGEAGRQHTTRSKITCDGAAESDRVPMKARGPGSQRETPRSHR